MAELDDKFYNAQFYNVTVVIEEEKENGKVKRTTEKHVVYGDNFKDVEAKVKKHMDGVMCDWKIKNIAEGGLTAVYGKGDDEY